MQTLIHRQLWAVVACTALGFGTFLHTRNFAHADDSGAAAKPRVVTPGSKSTDPPSDAVVIFDGKDLSGFVSSSGKPAPWKVIDGVIECKPGSGDIFTKEKIGDAQIHIEFATPNMPEAKSQGRGNSGIYLQNRYELQVLDSYKNDTYANGSCGAIYLAHVPLVNCCRPPEEWQTYDIIFRGAKVDSSGKLISPAYFTVLQNGILIQDHVSVSKPSPGGAEGSIGTAGPIRLQDHGNKVRFRNIWIRHLKS